MPKNKHSDIPDHYQQWEGQADPFEALVGPFFLGKDADGVTRGAFYAEDRHCNDAGALHGGILMTFGDFGLFVTARDALDGGAGVTVAFNSEFTAAGKPGSIIWCEGDVMRATRSLIFVRGRVYQDANTLIAYSGIIKKFAPPSA